MSQQTNCSNCGAFMQPGTEFCTHCGTPAVRATPPQQNMPPQQGFQDFSGQNTGGLFGVPPQNNNGWGVPNSGRNAGWAPPPQNNTNGWAPPPQQNNAWGAPPPPQGGWVNPPPPVFINNNTGSGNCVAWASLILGILGVWIIHLPLGIAGIITALGIKKNGNPAWITPFVLSIIGIVTSVIWGIIIIIAIVYAANYANALAPLALLYG